MVKLVLRIAVVGLALHAGTSVVPVAQTHVNALDDPPVVSVAGNQFLLNDVPFVPHGFNSIALLNSAWCTQTVTRTASDNLTATELDLAKNSWNANTLRFQVSQPVLASANGPAYAEQIEQRVGMVHDAGFVVILSMQDQSRACGKASPLPGPDTMTAWTTLLTNTDLGSNPSVMLELFNEPNNTELTTATTDPRQFTWVDWLNGGRLITPLSSNTWSAYIPIGHQDLVNHIRTSLQATNVLIADGARKGARLQGMPLLVDPGSSYQIAYALHPYYYTEGRSAWDFRWGYLAPTNALIATEWNYPASACGANPHIMAPEFLSYMRNTINVGILGHSLDSFDDLTTVGSLRPTKCGAAAPGAGADFFGLYMSTFAPPIEIPTPADLAGSAVSGNRIELTWSVPTLDQSTLAGYRVYCNGTLVATVTDAAYADTSVQNGTTYTYTVEAFDTMWRTSPRTSGVAIATPDEPGAPIIGTATGADSSATVQWTAPSIDGGSSIIRYDVRVMNSATGVQVGALQSAAASETSLLVTGLANGTAYRFQVSAVNSVGSSPLSALSNTVTPVAPATVPGAPTIGVATSGDASATARWTAPAVNGGAELTRYDVRVVDNATDLQVGDLRAAAASETSLLVTGLANGTAYRFQVSAVNSVGPSPLSASSNTVTPVAPATAPGVPPIGTATAANASATARWTAPSSDGGAAITRYDVRVVNNTTGAQVGALRTAAPSATSVLVSGLSNGTVYRFQVSAVNSVGSSPLSALSNTVTPAVPATAPGAPRIGTATRGSAGGALTATAVWSAPTSTGGSAITGYRVMTLRMSSSSSSASVLSTTTSAVLAPTLRQLSVTLANGNYRFQVVAINAIGTSARSARSNNIVPR